MKQETSLTKLFRLIELSRAQAQYGYVLAEIPKSDISDLAQHHYVVTFIAWRLARLVNQKGATINIEKMLEYALIHDLGELFGGDIAMPYAKANPRARAAAKKFEHENQEHLATLFDKDKEYIQELYKEIMSPATDEALITKIADYIEVTHYKLYVHRLSKGDIKMAADKIKKNINQLQDQKAKKALSTFIRQWTKELGNGRLDELFESAK